jgi:ABC-type multidrug transport system fused ATPase/permease subunit
MRARYLRAVLRQDMEYFDLRAGSTSEVVTSVSSDSLVVQDALAEKLPNFVMNATLFVSSYVFGFAVLWRLTLVALPSALLLVVPGIVYGRILTGIARRIREQYGRPGAIAEQAVSSARTVYASVAERSTVARFSAALEEPARLGVKQGLAKGVALGSNGLTFAIWAFNIWYGSRLVMYHGYPGGTVFAISSAIVNGGLCVNRLLVFISDSMSIDNGGGTIDENHQPFVQGTRERAVERQVLLGGERGGGEDPGGDPSGAQDRLRERRRRGAAQCHRGGGVQERRVLLPVATGEPSPRPLQPARACGADSGAGRRQRVGEVDGGSTAGAFL